MMQWKKASPSCCVASGCFHKNPFAPASGQVLAASPVSHDTCFHLLGRRCSFCQLLPHLCLPSTAPCMCKSRRKHRFTNTHKLQNHRHTNLIDYRNHIMEHGSITFRPVNEIVGGRLVGMCEQNFVRN